MVRMPSFESSTPSEHEHQHADYEPLWAKQLAHDDDSHRCLATRSRWSISTSFVHIVHHQHILVALIYVIVLLFTCIGLLSCVGLLSGSLQIIHYSDRTIQQAGWSRIPISIHDKTLERVTPTSNFDRDEFTDSNANMVETIWNIHNFSSSYSSTLVESSSSLSSSSSSSATANSFSSSSSTSTNHVQASIPSSEMSLLILTPLSSSSQDLSHYFSLLDTLTHPKQNTSLGFLIADENDDTALELQSLLLARSGSYKEISMIKKDFNIKGPTGNARHSKWWQKHRRAIMAKARTTLLMSTLRPSTDWVLWIDSDVQAYSPSLFEDLLVLGRTGVFPSDRANDGLLKIQRGKESEFADIVTPNIFIKKKDSFKAYDLNNWAETPKSLELKQTLDPEHFVFEGGAIKLHRLHLADTYTPPTPMQASPLSSIYPSLRPSDSSSSSMYDPRSPSFIGKRINLDGVGGVTTLVRAEAHRMGAIFPAFLMDHELETEGFGVMAKALGAKIVGLPNYIVLHANH